MSRLNGFVAALCLAVAVAALPAMAEEITVTVPMDYPPAAAAPEAVQEPVAEHTPAAVAQDSSNAAEPPAAAAPAAVEAPATEAPAAPVAAESPAPAVESAPEPVAETPQKAEAKKAPAPEKKNAAHKATAGAPAKAKKTVQSCKGLDADACGQNKACMWVVDATAPDVSGKTAASTDAKSRCRSLAMIKKEAKKHAKSKDEVLPWASAPAKSATPGSTAAAPSGAGATQAAPAVQ